MSEEKKVEQDERGACIHADEPKACYRVRCQLGNKCVDDEMSPLTSSPKEPQAPEDFAADAKRLALELECILCDCKDVAIVSKWWDSALEALEQHRALLSDTESELKTSEKTNKAEQEAFKEFHASLARLSANASVSMEDRVMILSNATFLLDEYARSRAKDHEGPCAASPSIRDRVGAP